MTPTFERNGITWVGDAREDLVLREFAEGRRWFGFTPMVLHTWKRPDWMTRPAVRFGLRVWSKLRDGREVEMHFDPRTDTFQGKVVVIEAPPPKPVGEIAVSYSPTQRPHPAWGGKG